MAIYLITSKVISSSLYIEIFWMVQKNFKSIRQHHGKVQIWLAFWNLCSGTAANLSAFCGLLSHFSFCWNPSFFPVPKQTFCLLAKALIYVNGNMNLPIELISYSYFYFTNKGHYKMIMDMKPPEFNCLYHWCTSFNHRPMRHEWFSIMTQKAFKIKYI
jgi:hypothetical protein